MFHQVIIFRSHKWNASNLILYKSVILETFLFIYFIFYCNGQKVDKYVYILYYTCTQNLESARQKVHDE